MESDRSVVTAVEGGAAAVVVDVAGEADQTHNQNLVSFIVHIMRINQFALYLTIASTYQWIGYPCGSIPKT